ncbi:MAG: hypothetical protein IJA79_08555 [Desulfovibrio sp.]|nr:hypothetical protein [Desulfovibrio sp.]
MEKLLVRLAQQLDAIDEASLMSLWSKYATATSRFEPTRRWEESALIFSLIQAKRWKNQLFNHNWAQQSRPAGVGEASAPLPGFSLEQPESTPEQPVKCRVLPFQPQGGTATDSPEKA